MGEFDEGGDMILLVFVDEECCYWLCGDDGMRFSFRKHERSLTASIAVIW